MKYRSRLLGSGTGTGAFAAFAREAQRPAAVTGADGVTRALSPCCVAGTCGEGGHK